MFVLRAPSGILELGTGFGQRTSRPFGAIVQAAGFGELPRALTLALGAGLGVLLPVGLWLGLGLGLGAAVAVAMPMTRIALAIEVNAMAHRDTRRLG
jgi:hypothetical protein